MIVKTQETMATGPEKALFQIYQVPREEYRNGQHSKDAVLTTLGQVGASTTCLMQAANVVQDVHSSKRKETARSGTSRIGRGKDHFHHPPLLRHLCATAADRTAEELQGIQHCDVTRQRGVKAQADRKMDLVLQDATSQKSQPWNVHQQPQSLITNGEQTCGRTRQRSLQHLRPVHLALQLQLLQHPQRGLSSI